MPVEALVAANAVYWSAERTLIADALAAASDPSWIARQCHKELFDGVVPRVEELRSLDPSTRSLTDVARELQQEADHFQRFADLYRRCRSERDPLLTREYLHAVAWNANAELGALRARHRREHGALGALAARLTEGGGCALFLAAMDRNDAIAQVCARVYDDERDHVGDALQEIERHDPSPAEWDMLIALTVEQSAARIPMRVAQFERSSFTQATVLAGDPHRRLAAPR